MSFYKERLHVNVEQIQLRGMTQYEPIIHLFIFDNNRQPAAVDDLWRFV